MVVWDAIGIFAAMSGAIGALLWLVRRLFPPDSEPLVEALDACLPQTQCAQCGFPGCLPYARAIVAAKAATDLCTPGGATVTARLDALLGEQGGSGARSPGPPGGGRTSVAWIAETECIGCAVCLDACPVEAIVGAHRWTHTVLARECTGCGLCLPPCPVDCIRMAPLPEWARWNEEAGDEGPELTVSAEVVGRELGPDERPPTSTPDLEIA